MANRLSFQIGSSAYVDGRKAKITAQADVDQFVVEFQDDGTTRVANIHELKSSRDGDASKQRTLDAISDKEMDEARRRFEIIEPLLEVTRAKTKAVAKRAEEKRVNERTIRRWLEAYMNRGRLSDLAPNRGGRRKTRLSRKVEALIQESIERVYLNKQKKSMEKVIKAVNAACKRARVKAPSPNTIRKRIHAVSNYRKTKSRHGAKAARDRYGAVKDKFPHGNYPLEVVQIDHTKLDLELVDDKFREPIGRPWLTLAIDVYSRMITGFYISLDPPSAFSVGMCIRHSGLPKETELEKAEIEGKWPVWGTMKTLHADNGKDFRSATIQKSCDEYGITLEWRPVRQPHFGGHIERLMGTVAKEIHSLPGTTFSNVRDKGEYNSAKQAVMTLDALRLWFLHYVVGVYHQREHRGIGVSPLTKWREGVFGTGNRKGTGSPRPIEDSKRFAIDFLPCVERTVQRDGISWDGIEYYSPALNRWIGEKKGGQSLKFLVRRDARDISRVHFLDPELREYLEIPYKNTSHPSVSIWQWREMKRRRKNDGAEDQGEEATFRAFEAMDGIVESERVDTRKARRTKQRNKDHEATRRELHGEERNCVDGRSGPRLVVGNASVADDEVGGPTYEMTDEDLKPHWEDVTW